MRKCQRLECCRARSYQLTKELDFSSGLARNHEDSGPDWSNISPLGTVRCQLTKLLGSALINQRNRLNV